MRCTPGDNRTMRRMAAGFEHQLDGSARMRSVSPRCGPNKVTSIIRTAPPNAAATQFSRAAWNNSCEGIPPDRDYTLTLGIHPLPDLADTHCRRKMGAAWLVVDRGRNPAPPGQGLATLGHREARP